MGHLSIRREVRIGPLCCFMLQNIRTFDEIAQNGLEVEQLCVGECGAFQITCVHKRDFAHHGNMLSTRKRDSYGRPQHELA
jgi:hypothetical protein